MASAWKLPVIFFIINNRYGISMDIHRATNTPHLYTRAEAYGIPGFYCQDGNDVMAVYETMGKAVEHVRGGNGPAIVEVESYRWFGHPLPMLEFIVPRKRLMSGRTITIQSLNTVTIWFLKNIASDEELDAIQSQVKAQIDAAYEFAQNSPDPELSIAFEDVWVD